MKRRFVWRRVISAALAVTLLLSNPVNLQNGASSVLTGNAEEAKEEASVSGNGGENQTEVSVSGNSGENQTEVSVSGNSGENQTGSAISGSDLEDQTETAVSEPGEIQTEASAATEDTTDGADAETAEQEAGETGASAENIQEPEESGESTNNSDAEITAGETSAEMSGQTGVQDENGKTAAETDCGKITESGDTEKTGAGTEISGENLTDTENSSAEPAELPAENIQTETEKYEPEEEAAIEPEEESGSGNTDIAETEEPQTDETRQTVLREELYGLTAEAILTDETFFPEGAVLQLCTLEELDGGEPQSTPNEDLLMETAADLLAEEYRKEYQDYDWTQEKTELLREAFLDSFFTSVFCEAEVILPDGSGFESEHMTLRFYVQDSSMAERLMEGESSAEIFAVSRPYLDSSEKLCDMEQIKEEYGSVSVLPESGRIVFEIKNAAPALYVLADADINWTWLDVEQAAASSVPAEISDTSSSVYNSFTQPGTRCAASTEYQPVTLGDRTYDARYEALRATSDTEVQFWNNSSSVISGTTAEGVSYMMPQQASDAGQFGFRITNVAYSRTSQCRVDMLVTVTGFQNYCVDAEGNIFEDIYPMIAINQNLEIFFQNGFPSFELKCDLVRSGTDNRVAGDYRFNWLDIDGGQRYGMALQDGSADARYCLTSSDVNYGCETLFGHAYHMLYAAESLSYDTELSRSVMFEISDTSGFYIVVGQGGDGSSGQHTSAWLKKAYAAAQSGAYTYTAIAKLCWNAGAYGPVELPAPVTKYVSNDKTSWSSSNTLKNVSDSWWYMLELYVPTENPEYYYSEFILQDILPDGAEYDGEYLVTRVESGEDVTDSFSASVSGKKLIFSADSLIGQEEFYGFTYQLIFKARMNTGELTPVWSGLKATYSVSNTGSLNVRHKGDTESTVTLSNSVVTAAVIDAPSLDAPEKWIVDEEKNVKDITCEDREEEITFLIRQTLPDKEECWQIGGLIITDPLENCFTLKSAAVVWEEKTLASWEAKEDEQVSGNWTLSIRGQNVAIALDGMPDDSMYGSVLTAELTVCIPEGTDLSSYYTTADMDYVSAVIQNCASTTIQWSAADTDAVTSETNTVTVRTKEPIPKGTITVRKTDSDGTDLSQAVYQIFAQEDIFLPDGQVAVRAGACVDTVTTGRDGNGVSADLLPGLYTVKEQTPPPGYCLNEAAQSVRIPEKAGEDGSRGQSVMFVNEPVRVYLKKISAFADGDSGEKVLAGAVFRIWNSETGSAENADIFQTDQKGLITLEKLIPGTYCYQETDAPEGYIVNTVTGKFTIDQEGYCEGKQDTVIVCENDFIKAEFWKTDLATGEPVAGASLQLSSESGEVIDTWISDTAAHRINRLVAGTYLLEELEAPSGYQKAEAVTVQISESAEVQSFSIENCRYVTICLTKEIDADDIVWAHGDPVFTFCVEGTDLSGEKHCYYDTVEFEAASTAKHGSVCQEVTFQVPAGSYFAWECPVIRYRLKEIREITGGSFSGAGVQFDLSAGDGGSAVFVNEKVNDSGLSDTDFVRNPIITP